MRARWRCPRQLRGPTEPVPSIIAANSRARARASDSASGSPAHSQTARVRIKWASSRSTTVPARDQPAAASRQARAAKAASCSSAGSVTRDRNIALHRRCASPSITMTLPWSWISAKAVGGRAWRRVKR